MKSRLFILLLLIIFPNVCYATIGLGGLVLFWYLFYIIAAVVLLVQIKFIFTILRKKLTADELKRKPRFFIATLVLWLILPSYYYLSVSPHVYWLCLLHLWLSFLVIPIYVNNQKIKRMTKQSIVIIGFILALITPNFVNLYQYVPVENKVLSNPQKVLVDYKNEIVELENGFYRKQKLKYFVTTGDIIELVFDGQNYKVFKRRTNYIKHDYLFNFQWFNKEYDMYKKQQVFGLLVKLDDNIEFKAAPNALTFYCHQQCNLMVLKSLVEKGADVNSQGSAGNSILHYVAGSGTIEHIGYLLDKGAKINGSRKYVLPISRALYNEKNGVDIIKFLLKKGAVINARFIQDLDSLPDRKRRSAIRELISEYRKN